MTEQRNRHQDNAAWQAARHWQERARQARPAARMSGPKMVLTWLLFGAMMIVGTVLGLAITRSSPKPTKRPDDSRFSVMRRKKTRVGTRVEVRDGA